MRHFFLIITFISIGLFSFSQKKNKLPYDRLEHVFYIDILGTNDLYHSFGYEFRYNVNRWMRIQPAIGFAMAPEISPSNWGFSMTPNLSFQFGKHWLWSELGFESSFVFNDPERKLVALSPRIGIHFKFARVFEIGVNYMPMFQNRQVIGTEYQLDYRGHWASVRFRFIMVSRKKKEKLGVWKLTFKNEIPYESYEDKRKKRQAWLLKRSPLKKHRLN